MSKEKWGDKVTEKRRIIYYNQTILKITNMEVLNMRYVCLLCGWEYDEKKGCPEEGIAPGTKWEDLPKDFVCPLCGVGKNDFAQRDD